MIERSTRSRTRPLAFWRNAMTDSCERFYGQFRERFYDTWSDDPWAPITVLSLDPQGCIFRLIRAKRFDPLAQRVPTLSADCGA